VDLFQCLGFPAAMILFSSASLLDPLPKSVLILGQEAQLADCAK
jgi:hypothetical protein